jgi:hypothetical protein
MTDFARDVNDALRAEKMQNLWKEYGPALLVGAATLVLGTAFFSGWNAWTLKQNQKTTTALLAALESKDPQASLEKALPHLDGAGAGLAQLNLAAAAIKENNIEKAFTAFDAAIDDRGVPALVRDLARVQKANLMLDQKNMTAAQIDETLKPVLKEKNSAFYAQAVLINAAAHFTLVKGDKNKAKESLKEMSADPALPASLKEQAAALLAAYEVE